MWVLNKFQWRFSCGCPESVTLDNPGTKSTGVGIERISVAVQRSVVCQCPESVTLDNPGTKSI